MRRLGDALIGLGAVVGVLAIGALTGGFEPSRLPPALLNLAAYKLAFVAAAGLLVVGAVVSRLSRRVDPPKDAAAAQLPPAPADEIARRSPQREHESRRPPTPG